MTTNYSLSQLGWTSFFLQQLSLDEWGVCTPSRVVAQHRSYLELINEHGKQKLSLASDMPLLTVGDWLLLDGAGHFHRALKRLSFFSRKAPGSKLVSQSIAANVDTVFVTCSLNSNFSLNRIERYLSLVKDAGADAVVVLTKADHCEDAISYVRKVQALDPLLVVEAVNGLDAASAECLDVWCREGKTVALLGSSGVGKSTLINTLLGHEEQATGLIRDADGKGRHTTTARTMHFMVSGGILLDLPGMRELQIADCEQGVKETFTEISDLEKQCRFNDCHHQNEPDCAIQAAIASGKLESRRLASFNKLMQEQAFNSTSLAEKRANDRSRTRYYRSVSSHAKQRKKGWS